MAKRKNQSGQGWLLEVSRISEDLTVARYLRSPVRFGSLKVCFRMSVIAVFPLKTGNSMFVGFDSQNTSYFFLHYPNWNLGVCGISPIGLREHSACSLE